MIVTSAATLRWTMSGLVKTEAMSTWSDTAIVISRINSPSVRRSFSRVTIFFRAEADHRDTRSRPKLKVLCFLLSSPAFKLRVHAGVHV